MFERALGANYARLPAAFTAVLHATAIGGSGAASTVFYRRRTPPPDFSTSRRALAG